MELEINDATSNERRARTDRAGTVERCCRSGTTGPADNVDHHSAIADGDSDHHDEQHDNGGSGSTTAPAQTQTTTTKDTTTVPTNPVTGAPAGPPQSATTTSTTTTEAAAIQPATAADVKKGASVYDQKGGTVGTIESVTAKGAIVSTGKVRVPIPVSSFAKNDKGLVISMTKAELDAQAPASTKTETVKKTTTKKTK